MPSGRDLATLAGAFGDLLRRSGVPVTPERAARFAAATTLARPADVGELYWLARVTLLDGPGQIEVFERVFNQVFRGIADVADFRGDAAAPPPPPEVKPGTNRRASAHPATVESDAPMPALTGAPTGPEGSANPDTVLAAASAEERLRTKDFASCSPEELALVARLVAALRLSPPRRPARRTVSRPSGRRLDVRRTLRRAHRTGGDPVRREFRRRAERTRRVVLIADVSGSMEAYSRVYLHLLAGAVRGARAEAFVFATRLTRLTRALRTGPPEVALARAMHEAPDWSGGTRIGSALKAFLDGHGRRGLARGAVVVIVSDGWERADPAQVGEQMARLARLAHRVVWVNPRKAAEGFAPLTGGMAAALPHVDAFVSGHSAAALDDVLAAIAST
ncbi:MAG TPA: VWA domain-containing protein [Actinomycetes bacterium]|nr:VWA domain-containing protein [Actinomycetes bacterium]